MSTTPVSYPLMDYVVFDLETTVRNVEGNNPVGSMAASPYHPANKIWLTGQTVLKNMSALGQESFLAKKEFVVDIQPSVLLADLRGAKLIVGQNIKFDLLYLMMHHYEEITDFFRRGGIVWDTMQAEYLLTNQQEKFAALGNKWRVDNDDDSRRTLRTLIKKGMAEKYGGTDKDDKIKEFWDAGTDTPDIPHEMLARYCYYDVKNTAIIFREQFRLARDKGQAFMNLLQTQMQAIIATTLMEYNGIKFNLETAHAGASTLAKEVDFLQEWLEGCMHDTFEIFNGTGYPIPRSNMNANSTKLLSLYLYGGRYLWWAPVKQYEHALEPHQVGPIKPLLYKTGARAGQQKLKKETVECTIIPECGALVACQMTDKLPTSSLGWSTDEDAIKKVVIPQYEAHTGATHTLLFCEKLLKFRSVYKDLNTYYLSLIELMWPTDGCIHGNLNQCATNTGRLTSSSPNMQNMSGGDQ